MGKVYWITGLSGAGKTTIGKALYEEIHLYNKGVVFLDGDSLRDVFGGIFGYTDEERRKCAFCYSRMCQMLQSQGLTVICCTISMFDEVRAWNREHIENYIEVYIKVSSDTLQQRDQKGMYSRGEANLMGVSMKWEEPKTPDIIIENDQTDISEAVNEILKFIKE